MSDHDEQPTPKTATATLAALVAKRKAAAKAGLPHLRPGGGRQSERDAAARSASKSKPAMRK